MRHWAAVIQSWDEGKKDNSFDDKDAVLLYFCISIDAI